MKQMHPPGRVLEVVVVVVGAGGATSAPKARNVMTM